jgi:enoyl-CoA hydratase/carnithine racemase
MQMSTQIDDSEVLYEIDDGIAVITFNRPEHRNGQTESMEALYLQHLRQADEDRDVRVVIVTGAGTTFCPGADMSYLTSVSDAAVLTRVPRPNCLYARTVRKPVVAAINGGCAGSGFLYALTCDVRIASSNAVFSTAFARRGLNAERAASWLLMRIAGEGVARELLLSGRRFDAEEALRLGLLTSVVEPGNALEATKVWAKDVNDNCSPVAMAMIKEQLADDAGRRYDEALVVAAEMSLDRLGSPELREGIRSFLEGHRPAFQPVGGRNDAWDDHDLEYQPFI